MPGPIRPHADNLGLLRLGFAALLFVAFAPQLVGGDRAHDLLYRLLGKLTLDDVATDALVLIAGYRAMLWHQASGGVWLFLRGWAACLLIPFIVAFWVSALIVGPLGGGTIPWSADLLALARLLPPVSGDAFQGLPQPELDHPLWVIAFLARALLLFTLAGWLGAFAPARRTVVLVVTVGLVALNALDILDGLWIPAATVFGYPPDTLRFASVLMTGACVALYRERLALNPAGAAFAAVALIPMLAVRDLALAEGALTVCGGYLLFWAAFDLRPSQHQPRLDIAYGLYLYAWPAINLALWFMPGCGPLAAGAVGLAGAVGAATLSARVIERPIAQALKRQRRPHRGAGVVLNAV